LKVIRERFWLSHPTPFERQIINEFTLENDTEEYVQDIFLIDLPLMLGLEVFGENSKRLPFLPNRDVRRKLEQTIKNKQQFDDFIKTYLQHKGGYFLWIRLTLEDKIAPGDYKIIRLKYFSRERPQIPNVLVTLYSIARYTFNITKTKAQDYDIFVNIQAPTGSSLRQRASAMEGNHSLTENEGFYQSRLDDFLQIRIPNRNSEIIFNVGYDIQPPRLEKRFVSLTLVLLYVTSILLIILTLSEKIHFVNEAITNFVNSFAGESTTTVLKAAGKGILKRAFEITGGIIATSVAIAGLVKNPLFSRARWFYLGTTALAIIAFIIKGG